MKERPILFQGSLVRAILAGTKTVTRRPVKPANPDLYGAGWQDAVVAWEFPASDRSDGYCGDGMDVFARRRDGALGPVARNRYGTPGDRLWVRETWGTLKMYDEVRPCDLPRFAPTLRPGSGLGYRADADPRTWCQTGCNGAAGRWRPSIHMPRWASRLTLEVVSVRVERLQEITEEDARAEGAAAMPNPCGFSATDYFRCCDAWPHAAREKLAHAWDGIYGPRSWDANPWVWRVEFRRVEST